MFTQFEFLGYLGDHCRMGQSSEKYWQNFRRKISTQSVSAFAFSLLRFIREITATKQQHVLVSLRGTSHQYQSILKQLIDLSNVRYPTDTPSSPPIILKEMFDIIDYFWDQYTHQLYRELSQPVPPVQPHSLLETMEALRSIGYFKPGDILETELLDQLNQNTLK